MEDCIQHNSGLVFTISVVGYGYFLSASQKFIQRGICTAQRVDPDAVEDGGFADAVLAGKQGHAAEAGNRELVDPPESRDGQIGKVERLAHGMLHPADESVSPLRLIVALRIGRVGNRGQLCHRDGAMAWSTSWARVQTMV